MLRLFVLYFKSILHKVQTEKSPGEKFGKLKLKRTCLVMKNAIEDLDILGLDGAYRRARRKHMEHAQEWM